jgi:hypothetical protein
LAFSIDPFPPDLLQPTFSPCGAAPFPAPVAVLGRYFGRRVIEILTTSISANAPEFAACRFAPLVRTLVSSLSDFDPHAMSLITIKVDPCVIGVISDFPRVLLRRIEHLPIVTPRWPAAADSPIAAVDRGERPSDASDSTDVDCELDAPAPSAFSSGATRGDFLSPEHLRLMEAITVFLSQVLVAFFGGFFDLLEQHAADPRSVDLFVCFFVILCQAPQLSLTDRLFHAVTSEQVFRPGVSLFSPSDNFAFVGWLREQTVSILAYRDPAQIARLLRALDDKPYLFADLIGRIYVRQWGFNFLCLTDDQTLGSIVHVISDLSLLCRRSDAAFRATTHQAKSTICLFLMAICQEQAVATQCFSNPLFVTGFLSRIVDPSLHAPILSLIRHFFTHFDAPLGIVAECICDIVDGCMDDTRVVSELLQCVNDSMTHSW